MIARHNGRRFQVARATAIVLVLCLAILFCAKLPWSVAKADGVSGEAIYQKKCASCHDQTMPRVPPRAALQKLTAARILRTLDFGVMMSVAYPLKRDEREAVSKYLGTANEEPGPAEAAFCADRKLTITSAKATDWNGWSPASSNSRFQTANGANLTAEKVKNLKLKWAFGFAGDFTSFAGTTVYDGALFVGSASGTVHAMNAKSGCLYWVFQARGPVRSAPVVAEKGNSHVLLFSDQIGWFYAVDAETGKQLWVKRIDEHEATRLTGSVAMYDGIVFVPAASWEETRSNSDDYPCCTFQGSVTALNVVDGALVWKKVLMEPLKKTGVSKNGTGAFGPSGAGVWAAPTIDAKRGLVYVTTGDNYSLPATKTSDAIVALSMKTGEIVWSRQTTAGDIYGGGCWTKSASCPKKMGPDFDYGASAILVSVEGKDLVLAGQKSGMVYALDPDAKGKIVWRKRVGVGGETGGVQWGMASDEKFLYAAVSDLVRVEDEGSPLTGNHAFDPVKGGGLTALRLRDGGKAWFAASHPCTPPRLGCSPAQSAAVSVVPGVVFSGSLDGHIRAFATNDGNVLWDFDTEKEFTTVNGVSGHGGSLDGAGPVIADGMVYVNSGYPRFGGAPGNVLLAFSADE